MKRLILLQLFLSSIFLTFGQAVDPLSQASYLKGELTFKTRYELNFRYEVGVTDMIPQLETLIRKYKIRLVEKVFASHMGELPLYYYVKFDGDQEGLIKDLAELDWIEKVERLPEYRINYKPNDQRTYQ